MLSVKHYFCPWRSQDEVTKKRTAVFVTFMNVVIFYIYSSSVKSVFQTLLFNSMPSTPFGKFNLIGQCKNIHHSRHESRVLVIWILYIVLFFCAKCVWTMTAPSLTGAIWKDGLSCEEEQKTQCIVPLAYSPSDVHKNLFFFFSAHTVILYSNCTINLWGKVDSRTKDFSFRWWRNCSQQVMV